MYCKSLIVVLHDLWQQTDSVDKLRLSFEDTQVCSLCINIIVTNKLTSSNKDAHVLLDSLVEDSVCLICHLCGDNITKVHKDT